MAEEVPEQEVPEQEQQPADDYVGPQETDIVGDKRRLRVVSINPDTGDDSAGIGEAWQDEEGNLNGSGIAAVMFFEPISVVRYRTASLKLDLSPLSVFYNRISRSAFFRAEFIEASNGSD